ncbi:MBL fold metallo-hydrolase [Bacillus taeanensis]|uniref:MBL fold metallo-hydrolase n=1 Tax=Bacillus taeanensis TaxID=273032 RepID=A0A366XYD8_9BACI|nr:MBL fold metallo-hydrolase [Bacillus taeanensis]RBW71162.1 MBL fold metallo-hydrolase [Bacillus taeanensis]
MPVTSVTSGIGLEVTKDVFCLPVQIVNVCFIGNPTTSNTFVLIDAGMPNSAEIIIREAEERFGQNCRAEAIILTHGHFDHVGAVLELTEKWNTTVYAHSLELPYLTGKADYPPADPEADSGMIAKMSPIFPRHSINLKNHIRALPDNGRVPELKDWRWIHTPGHTPGHISLFREGDRFLIAGDAFTTVKQESLFKVVTQQPELNGPPAYFTPDWKAASHSVKQLAELNPWSAVTGHGRPMSGEELTAGLQTLAANFDKTEIPKQGRYTH